MAITYLGGLSIGGAAPGAVSLAAAGSAGINAALPDIQARLEALLAFQPTPVDFTVSLNLALQTLAGIQLAISTGISPPDISAQIAIVMAQIADITASIASINAQLTIIADFQALFGEAGLHAYAFSGPTNQMGTDIAAQTSSGLPGGTGATPVNALLLATTLSTTWTALGQLLKTAP